MHGCTSVSGTKLDGPFSSIISARSGGSSLSWVGVSE